MAGIGKYAISRPNRCGGWRITANIPARKLPYKTTAMSSSHMMRRANLDTLVFIRALPDAEKAPYVYHYFIGRQLAGVDQESRLSDVSQSFGEEYIAKLELAE